MRSCENDSTEQTPLTMDSSLCSDQVASDVIEAREYHGGDGLSCAPFSTLDQIWQWSQETWPDLVTDLAPKSAFVIPGSRISCIEGVQPRLHKDSVPRTIFCHDLKGGYLEDRYVNGSPRYSEYRFFHWSGIDTFIYFSHHLLTVPPVAWISAGHLHGVPVLGTLITEGRDGARVWERVLVDLPTTVRFADTLAAICRHFRFDGYLLNVENEVEEVNVSRLVRFVTELRHSLRRMGLAQAQVIWYDSVTCRGKLDWQNELNGLNRCFFDACDGIFLNYTWTEQNLRHSLKTSGARCLDVYVGIDVFGRNCYGGGGFDSDKAASLIRSFGLSIALFAASWTHECLDRRNFTLLEYLFWQKLWPYLYIHGPNRLPFSTTFCQGYGTRIFKNGEVHADTPWYNLRKQQYQPCTPSALQQRRVFGSHVKNPDPKNAGEAIPAPACPKEEAVRGPGQGYVAHHSEDAFAGGGCLKIGGPGSYGMKSKHVLLGAEQGGAEPYAEESQSAVRLHRPLSSGELLQVRASALDRCAQRQLVVEGAAGWDIRHYSLEIDGVILEVGAEVSNEEDPVLLGWIAISRLDGY